MFIILTIIGWAFFGYIEYLIHSCGEKTLLIQLFGKLGVDFRPKAEAGWLVIAFLLWARFGWYGCLAGAAAMSLQLIISAHMFKHFYRRGCN